METLEGRVLMSAVPVLMSSATALAFNSAEAGTSGAGPSHVDVLTLTNTGAVPLNFGAISVVADPSAASDNSSLFSITNLASVPSMLVPGASTNLDIIYTASATGIQPALLQIPSDDPSNPTLDVALNGMGTAGQFGYDEPSLAQILLANNIPTNIGVTDINNSQYPLTPSASSQEVAMPRLVKAGDGPVTITMLASFNASASPSVRFGYYTPGQATSRSELFTIAQSDDQTVNPTALGATSFDPGSNAFGLYAVYPGISTSNGQPDIHYSEDWLNTLDAAHPRKFRFFPMENPDGSIVPNTYIVAGEDYNGTTYNSFTNFVAIISNVMAAPDAVGAPVMGLTNPDALPGSSTIIFNRIQNLNPDNPSGFVDQVHDINTIQISNTGDQNLVISSLALSDTTNWQIVNPPSLPLSIAPGGKYSLTIQFIAQTVPAVPYNETNNFETKNYLLPTQAGGVWSGTLTVLSNDPISSSRSLTLNGYWQDMSENENEPSLQTISNLLLGYGTQIAGTIKPDYPNLGTTPVYYADEVASAYWNVADPTLPVSVVGVAAFHSQFDLTNNTEPAPIIGWYPQGSSSMHWLFQEQPGAGQSLFPTLKGSTTTIASGSFKPAGTFGWNVDGENSLDSANTADLSLGRSGHSVRFYPVRDSSGNLVPNTWLVAMDYETGTYDNSDYQDLVYLVTNMRPATQAPAPTDVQATGTNGAVSIEWAPVNDPTLIGYNVYRATSPSGPWSKLDTNAFSQTSFTDIPAATGTYYYQVAALDSSAESKRPTNVVNDVAPAQPADVLTSLDINAQPAGSTQIVTSGKDYNITGGGGDIGGTNADGFRYAYESITGDFDVQVQVTSLSMVQSGTRAGLMVRTDLTPGSQMVFVGGTASDGYRFNYRTTANAVGTYVKYGSVSYPNVWVRLVRSGNIFMGYYSADGTNWTKMQSLTLALPNTIDLGLAVSSHTNTTAATAAFRHFNLTLVPPTAPPPQQPPPNNPPPNNPPQGQAPLTLTPAQQVAADRTTLAQAIAFRVSKLLAARKQLISDVKAYMSASKALNLAKQEAKHTHQAIDSSLSDKITTLLGTVSADKSLLASLLKSDFTGIAADKAKLARDLAALRLSLRHK